jgi:hypothetical protein
MTCDQRPVLHLQLPDGFDQLQRTVVTAAGTFANLSES